MDKDVKLFDMMIGKYYDVTVWKNPYTIAELKSYALKKYYGTKIFKHVKLITINGVFTGDMYFTDDDGSLLIIPFCMVVYMTPSKQ